MRLGARRALLWSAAAATLGKPGMPSFGFALSEAEIQALVAYLRALPLARAPRAAAGRRMG